MQGGERSGTADDGTGRPVLDGVRVVDFTRLLPGPWCTQLLGDLGADVVKVEQPEIGDYGRFNPPNYREVGVYFNSINRNKRSIELDLTTAADREVVRHLLDKADIVVESFRAGVTGKLGIDYATVTKTNPDVVYCSVTGLGNDSSLGQVPGHDLSVQAVSGTLGKMLEPGRVPSMPTFQAADFTAAAYAAMGILAAHVRRLTTGAGCYIEVPMYDSVICASNVALSGELARIAGYAGKPEMEPWGSNPRYCIYPTRDGKAVAVCLLEMRTWHRFCRHVGRDDLIYDEGWADRHTAHGERAAAFREAIAQVCMSRDRDALAEEMRAAGISITPVYDTAEALRTDHARERGVVGFAPHPTEGDLPYLRDPLARAGLSDPARRPSPGLGEHSAEIRAEIDRDTMAAREPAS